MGHALSFRAWPVSFEPGFFLGFRVFHRIPPVHEAGGTHGVRE
jgi:hypothetical protein